MTKRQARFIIKFSMDEETLSDLSETFVTPTEASIINNISARGIETPEQLENVLDYRPYVVLSGEILENENLSLAAKILFSLILGLSSKEGYCYASNAHLAKRTAISIRTISRTIKELALADLLKIGRKVRPSGAFRLLIPIAKVAQPPRQLDAPSAPIWPEPLDNMATINKRVNEREIKGTPLVSPKSETIVGVSPPSSQKPQQPLKPQLSQNPVHRLVRAWRKMLEVSDAEAATWERANFARCCKSAKLLLEICHEDLEQAADCALETLDTLKAKGLECTLETVTKKAHQWRQENGKTSDKTYA